MNFQLKNNEKVVKEGSANHWKGIEGVSGQLWLTNFRLFFKSHFFNVQTHEESYLLGDIATVKCTTGIFTPSNRIVVDMKNGRSETFTVENRDDWVKQISELLSMNFVLQESTVKPNNNSNYKINLLPNLEKVQVNAEKINVPNGVIVKVKRSRTIEHTVDVNWQTSGGINIDAGLKQLISASIYGELEYSKGQSIQKSETIEYEVELNGDKSNKYKLVWIDIWQKGIVEFQNNTLTAIPFQFRERSELTVAPDTESYN